MRIATSSRDGQVRLSVTAAPAGTLRSELFSTLDDAASFFRQGALGFSPASGGCLDGVRLQSASWAMQPMTAAIRSSVFDDPARFPPGTCMLDSALVMRNVPARWVPAARSGPFKPLATGTRTVSTGGPVVSYGRGTQGSRDPAP